MRAVLIDPTAKTIDVIESQSVREATIRFFSEKPATVLRLPRGDVVLAAKAAGGDGFILGGSRPIGGPALVVGCSVDSGERASALVDPSHVIQMVRWASIEEFKTADKQALVRAIEIDPERQSIEPVSIAPKMLALQHRLGGEIRVCYRAPGSDVVLCRVDAMTDRYEWQKDDAVFRGRCLVIGLDGRKRFSGAAVSLAELREDVSFRVATMARA
ncbi:MULTISPECIES: hypothetical protein [Bradyrhizobium]|uniref:hypothetical protein n=1 Tax=Bradyrhizobium TaxID=374 RepID=UPI001EDC53A0|nr:hypothetical protein [Bradyrhizobium zhengyangense]MCG2645193.1 hypothetical protein [Bradyrhizobium zhengyangense]